MRHALDCSKMLARIGLDQRASILVFTSNEKKTCGVPHCWKSGARVTRALVAISNTRWRLRCQSLAPPTPRHHLRSSSPCKPFFKNTSRRHLPVRIAPIASRPHSRSLRMLAYRFDKLVQVDWQGMCAPPPSLLLLLLSTMMLAFMVVALEWNRRQQSTSFQRGKVLEFVERRGLK